MHTFFVVLERRERFRRGTHNFRPQLYATHQCPWSWASANSGKWGQLTPLPLENRAYSKRVFAQIVHSELKSVHPGIPVAFIF